MGKIWSLSTCSQLGGTQLWYQTPCICRKICSCNTCLTNRWCSQCYFILKQLHKLCSHYCYLLLRVPCSTKSCHLHNKAMFHQNHCCCQQQKCNHDLINNQCTAAFFNSAPPAPASAPALPAHGAATATEAVEVAATHCQQQHTHTTTYSQTSQPTNHF